VRTKSTQKRTIAVAWAVACAGVAVGLFHAGTFPYFWMTLGLFPATALALGLDAVLQLLDATKDRIALVALIGSMLLIPSLRASLRLLHDSQAAQRAALTFVDRNFEPRDRGFHPESALCCRTDPQPFPTLFSQHIAASFYGADSSARIAAFILEFRKKPVSFILSSFRLEQFPPEIKQFWSEHYVPYRDNVFVPGRELGGADGTEVPLDILVAGKYRWWPGVATGARCVSIDGRQIGPSHEILLEAGIHSVQLQCSTRGWLALALRDPPGDGIYPPFYGLEMQRENSGYEIFGP
jgi:hypothetical protein